MRDKGTRRLLCYCTSRHLVPNAFSDRACSGAFAQNPHRCTCGGFSGQQQITRYLSEAPGPSSILAVPGKEEILMAFFNSAVDVLQTLVVALGAGLGIWGAINLLEGYGNDNPGANAHVR